MSENLVSYLLDIGCCYNCCSRYTCAKNVDFENADLCTIKVLSFSTITSLIVLIVNITETLFGK